MAAGEAWARDWLAKVVSTLAGELPVVLSALPRGRLSFGLERRREDMSGNQPSAHDDPWQVSHAVGNCLNALLFLVSIRDEVLTGEARNGVIWRSEVIRRYDFDEIPEEERNFDPVEWAGFAIAVLESQFLFGRQGYPKLRAELTSVCRGNVTTNGTTSLNTHEAVLGLANRTMGALAGVMGLPQIRVSAIHRQQEPSRDSSPSRHVTADSLESACKAIVFLDLDELMRLTPERDREQIMATGDATGVPSHGYPAAAESTDLPAWDKERGELRVGSELAKRLQPKARNQILILCAFQECGWPWRVDDPLPHPPDDQRLRQTVSDLNDRLKILRFYCDGTGKGITWRMA